MNLAIFSISFFGLLFIGVPIGYVMMISSAIYFFICSEPVFLMALPEKIFSGLDMLLLTAIPFFMLAGEIMNRAGMSDRLVSFSNQLIGRFRGGLAQVNVLSSILFAGITGVALGDVAALGKIFIPTMEKQGYTRKFAAAVTAASSIVGPIIPPSALTVLYCAIMETSVGGMFVAAIIPGVLIGLSDMIIVAILAKKNNFPKYNIPFTPKTFVYSLRDASLAIIMPFLIIGGILGGVFTPAEAAAAAVVYAVVASLFIMRSIKGQDLFISLKNSVFDSARLFFIIGGASIVSWIFAMENVDDLIALFFQHISQNKVILILLINAAYLILGMWLEPGIMIMLFAPVIAPFAYNLGMHPIQFGIMVLININIGILTPPVGVVLFAVSDIAKVSIWQLGREMLPFFIANIVVVLMVAFFPELTLWLPGLFGFVN